MKRAVFGVLGIWLLLGCGRMLTPVPASGPASPTLLPGPVSASYTPRPTSTPRPATPVATPTPTVTPTPIIYAVQAGDTLLDIAIQFDRSTEAIQEANGIVDPRFLQIGQKLVIPAPQASAEDPPTPTPTPPPVTVRSVSFQDTRQGTLWCLGEVYNPGSDPLAEVVVEVALFDGAGVLLAREAAFTQLDVIQPGQGVPFAILFKTPPTSFAQYQVAAVAGVPLSPQARYYLDLEALDVTGSVEGADIYRLRGQLRNYGSEDAESVRLVAVIYDEEERVLAQRQAELAVSLLKAGAATPFELDLTVTRGIVDHYKILVQGLKAHQ